MKLLELFAGTHTLSDVFASHGWETYTVDWDPSTDVDLHADIGALTAEDVIALCGGVPDVIWASPDCTTYSVAAIGRHRVKEPSGNLAPVSDYAKMCDRTNLHVIDLMIQLQERGTRFVFVENPRGGLRKMPWMNVLRRYTVTYCQYGETRMKPTDIWTNHPDPQFKPPCRNGDPCHERAPRGSRTGTQGIDGKLPRAKLPAELCEHVFAICSGAGMAAPPRQARLGELE